MENLYKIQILLEQAEKLYSKPALEDRPFDYKYESRSILEGILKDYMPILPEDLQKKLEIYIHYQLGLNFLETEEHSSADQNLKKSLEILITLENPIDFSNILQDIYNNLGFLNVNRDENELGISLLRKAELLYSQIHPKFSLVLTNSENYLLNLDAEFTIPFLPKLSKSKTESLYTLTLFFLAQAYTKLGFKEKAALYCGNTMKRQYATKEYQLRDWCVNCISLAEYYMNNELFAQSYYLLMGGFSLVKDLLKKLKLKATFHMSLGRLFNEYLKFVVRKWGMETCHEKAKECEQAINRKELVFDGLSAEFINLEFPKTQEEITKLYRQSNTQYKKALEFFVLDGYVTEYITINKEISQMIKHYAMLEKKDDFNKLNVLLEKRADILEPIRKALNPKAYPGFYDNLIVELAEIYNELTENLLNNSIINGKKTKIEKINGYGLKTIEMYKEIENVLLEQKEDKNKDYYQSVINTKFNIAKAFSRLQGQKNDEKINYLKQSLENYKGIVNLIRSLQKEKGLLEYNFSEQLKICEEMVDLIPIKISKIN